MREPEHYMRLAIAEARRALAARELPYACVIVAEDGRVVAAAHDRVAETGDPTSHAELDAVRAAVRAQGSLAGCTAFSTVEPCCMCSGAAWTAGLAGFVYGLGMAELKAIMPHALDEPIGPLATVNATVERKLAVAGGLLREECLALWRETRP